jgi:hypothetical protein
MEHLNPPYIYIGKCFYGHKREREREREHETKITIINVLG